MKDFIKQLKFDPNKMKRLNEIILKQPDVIVGGKNSLSRSDFMMSSVEGKPMKITNMIKLLEMPRFIAKVIPNMKRSTEQSIISSESLSANPQQPLTLASPEIIAIIEKIAKNWNCTSIGYTQVPDELIFQNCGIMYRSAIVLTMEMDKHKISQAPSLNTMETVFQSYADLGEVVNIIAAKLRELGYGAHAGPAIGGSAYYPELAQSAGLGYRGRNGMLISPENGSSQRIAAVYTSIEHLPFATENKHEWISRFCAKCGKCIKACPSQAIYPQPQKYENNDYRSYVNGTKCRNSFMKYGCSICIKVCPFVTTGYAKLHKLTAELI